MNLTPCYMSTIYINDFSNLHLRESIENFSILQI